MDAITKKLYTDNGNKFPRNCVLLYDGGGYSDALIRTVSGALYSHVAISLGGGLAVAAWGAAGKVVTMRDWDVNGGYKDVNARPLPAGFDYASEAINYIGVPYDWPAIYSYPLFRLTKRGLAGGPPKAFICSALVAWVWRRANDANNGWGVPIRYVSPQLVANAVGL